MGILADVQEWQEGLSGLATLFAGAIAYLAILRQIRSDRELSAQQLESDRRLATSEQKHREAAFLTVIASSVETYRFNLEDLGREVEQIRSALSSGIDLRKRLPYIQEASEFDTSLIEDWDKYRSFSIELIGSIRNFYDAYRHQKRLLNSIHTRAAPDMPLLRAVNPQDAATESLHASFGSLIVAISATRACLENMNSEIQKVKPGGDER